MERVVVNLEQISKEDSRDFRKKLKHRHDWEDDMDYFGGDYEVLERYGKLRKNVDNLRLRVSPISRVDANYRLHLVILIWMIRRCTQTEGTVQT